VKFEYDVQTNQRHGLGPQRSNLDKVTAKGWYVSGTYLITGEEKRLSAPVHPTYPFAPIAGQWGSGAWELGMRYADLSFSSDDPSLGEVVAGDELPYVPRHQASVTAGVDYLDQTADRYRIFSDLWMVRSLLLRKPTVPSLENTGKYRFRVED